MPHATDCDFDSVASENQGCLPFTQTTQVEILCINIKL